MRVDDIFKTFTNPKTSDAYLQRQLDYDTAKYKASREMPNFWTSIESKTKDLAEDTLNDKVLTDLINIHVRLSETNTLLEKKIPEMQANCMKGQPDIVGGCRSAR